MLKLWENPMLSVEDRLEAAGGEIERLRGLLDYAEGMFDQLRAENERLKAELAEAKKELGITKQVMDFLSKLTVGAVWRSADIDWLSNIKSMKGK